MRVDDGFWFKAFLGDRNDVGLDDNFDFGFLCVLMMVLV